MDQEYRRVILPQRIVSRLDFPGAPSVKVNPPGPHAKKLLEAQRILETQAVTYPDSFPTAWEAGSGSTLRDVDGNLFIDWASGVSVLNVGHGNPEVTKAVIDQASRIVHALEIPTAARVELLQEIHSILPGHLRGNGKVLFSVTGADAVEASVKVARYTTGGETIVAFEGGYHGMDMGALSLTANRKYKKKIGPLMPGVYRVPYPYPYRDRLRDEKGSSQRILDYVEHIFEDPDSGLSDPAAILVEPIQGEGGYIVPPDDFLPGLRKIADRYGVRLIVDEVQTGLGRTGRMWGCECTRTTPDIMPVSKSIGGGIPLALVALSEGLDEQLPKGFHLGTYRGNPLGCAAGAAVIRYLKRMRLPQRAARLGPEILKRFQEVAEKSTHLGEVRGQGFMIGLEFVKEKKSRMPAPELVTKLQAGLFKRGLIMLKAGHYSQCLRFVPPLNISRDLIDKGLEIFETTLRTFDKN